MTDTVNRFYNSIENASGQSQGSLIELFVYFLTVEIGQDSATAKEVDQCFTDCDLTPPKATASRLSEGLKTKPQKFVKLDNGYKLQRHMREALSKQLGGETMTSQTSATLRSLEHKMPPGRAREFLSETLDCFEVSANRATIVMAWILAINHLCDYIFTNKLAEFNAELAKNTDKRVKVKIIMQRDDFSDIPEVKFIELCRSAKIVSNDVRKILDQKLGTRNSCAHPSGVRINRTKAIDFVEDLVENVVLKFTI
ncbi:hypothetical protein ROTO_28400 [Roseovarius tolerans]|uniref:Uncharacterized protein n=1 Tax=Roseovarius tolerans TaxID=74031 RepID=A0A0L6CS58_9RHOB|nr:hypothetical protein [Roseovarius tolerans]KNX40599.1 hypothetical protein ROTO_28400 [Roseovarius tolerans]